MTASYETKKMNSGYAYVVGCDEVGRGCLAGPVVAAAVVLDPGLPAGRRTWFHEVNDSKTLTFKKREALDAVIRAHARGVGIGAATPGVIDRINIHRASLLAMKRAVENLFKSVSCESEKVMVCVDGKFVIPSLRSDQEAVVDGDAKILSVAAASILAKVFRDRLMAGLDRKYPGYNFSRHKGYATLEHRTAIAKIGLSPVHRLTFCGNARRSGTL